MAAPPTIREMNRPLERPESEEPLIRPVMPELDSIRGLAILAVLFYHGFFWGVDVPKFSRPVRILLTGMWAGRLGVNLFFVLSGFLITGLLIDSRNRRDYYSRFYKRRALRILPAYLLTILVLVVVKHTPWKFIALSLLYLSNLTPIFGIAIAYPILWSLAVEEHFYLVWPAVVRNLTDRRLISCCLAIILLSPLSRLVSFYWGGSTGFTALVRNEYTWNSADGLACGALLSIWLRVFQPSRLQVRRLTEALVGLAAAMELAGWHWGIWTRKSPLGAAMQIVPWNLLFVALLCAFLLAGTSRWKGVSQSRFLGFFGEISYGLYLYHLLFFEAFNFLASHYKLPPPNTGSAGMLVIRFLVASSAAIAVSYVSRKQFEDRFLRLKTKFTAA